MSKDYAGETFEVYGKRDASGANATAKNLH